MEPGSQAHDSSQQPKNEGRKRIKNELIPDLRSRQTTFHKRKNGLMKKAMELSTMCGSQVCVIIFNQKSGKLFEYSEPSAEEVLRRYATYTGPGERRKKENFYDIALAKTNCNLPENEPTLSAAAINAAEMAARRDSHVSKFKKEGSSAQVQVHPTPCRQEMAASASYRGASSSSRQLNPRSEVLSTAEFVTPQARAPPHLLEKGAILKETPANNQPAPHSGDQSITPKSRANILPTFLEVSAKSRSDDLDPDEDVVTPVRQKRQAVSAPATDNTHGTEPGHRLAPPSLQHPSSVDLVSLFARQAHEALQKVEDEVANPVESEVDESDSSESESDVLQETQVRDAPDVAIGSDVPAATSALTATWGTMAPNIEDFSAMLETPADQYLNSPYFLEQILHGTSQLEYPSYHEFSPGALVTPPTNVGHGITRSGSEPRLSDDGVTPASVPSAHPPNLGVSSRTLGKRAHGEKSDVPASRRRGNE